MNKKSITWLDANEFRVGELGFRDGEVGIRGYRMAGGPELAILWIKAEVVQLRSVFMGAAIKAKNICDAVL